MCNTYTLFRDTLKDFARGRLVTLNERQKQLLETEGKYLVRPTMPAPVLLPSGEIPLMRWGFVRPWAKAINNARIEKRDTMWKTAWATGRCLIPMGGWYEFSGESRHLTCHLLEPVKEGPLLAAGLWEPHEELGNCFTMIMAEAGPETQLGKIHNRMPILLSPEDGARWMAGASGDLTGTPGIEVTDNIVPSPLKKHKDTLIQTDLF